MTHRWAVLEEYYNRNPPFLIDAHFAALPLAEPCKSLRPERVIEIGRKTLEVAIGSAIDASEDLSAFRGDWQNLARLTGNAEAHIAVLMKNLAPSGKDDDLAMTLKSVLAGRPGAGNRRAEAYAIVRALKDAKNALDVLSASAKQHDAKIAKLNKNDTAADRRAFAATFAEAWTWLTGQLPPTSRNKENPFRKMLEAGWRDAGHSPSKESFDRPISDARGAAKAAFKSLTSRGPDWCDILFEAERLYTKST